MAGIMIFLIFPVAAFLCGASSGLITRHYRLWKQRQVEQRAERMLAGQYADPLISAGQYSRELRPGAGASEQMMVQPKNEGHVLLDWAMALAGGFVQLTVWFFCTIVNVGVASAGDKMSVEVQGSLFWLIAATALGLVPLIVWIVVLAVKRHARNALLRS